MGSRGFFWGSGVGFGSKYLESLFRLIAEIHHWPSGFPVSRVIWILKFRRTVVKIVCILSSSFGWEFQLPPPLARRRQFINPFHSRPFFNSNKQHNKTVSLIVVSNILIKHDYPEDTAKSERIRVGGSSLSVSSLVSRNICTQFGNLTLILLVCVKRIIQ